MADGEIDNLRERFEALDQIAIVRAVRLEAWAAEEPLPPIPAGLLGSAAREGRLASVLESWCTEPLPAAAPQNQAGKRLYIRDYPLNKRIPHPHISLT